MTISESDRSAPAGERPYMVATLAAVFFFFAGEAAYFALSGLPALAEPSLDFTGDAVGRDFLINWMAGRSVLGYGPTAWFDPSVYNAALRVLLGPNFPEHFWFYPPHLVLFTWPVGLLPYLAAYAAWCLLGLALYVWASLPFVRREHLLFAVAAPGVAVCIFFGQNGFYAAALLLGGLAVLQRQQIAAGILFGILTVKPQFALLLPIMLVLSGRWLALFSMIATAAVLAAAAGYIFGWEIWPAFLEKFIQQQDWLLARGDGLSRLTAASVFSGVRLTGLPSVLAWYGQALASLFAVAAVIWTYKRHRDPMLSIALLVTAIFLVTPYVLGPDMVVLGCIVAMLRMREDNTPLDHYLGLAVWSLPVTMMLFGAIFIPLAPLVLTAFALRLLQRMQAQEPVTAFA